MAGYLFVVRCHRRYGIDFSSFCDLTSRHILNKRECVYETKGLY